MNTAGPWPPPRRAKLWASLAIVLMILAGGTVGYRVIEGWPWRDCLYMTTITITTVGFNEVHDLSPGGESFTILLILFGVGTMAFALTAVVETVFQRQLRFFTERQGMHNEIDRLNRHILLCGYGRTARLIARELRRTNHAFVVVDQQSEALAEAVEDGLLSVQGNATDEEVLEKAGIERAEALVAALGSDADNLLLTITARGMNPKINIIARSREESREHKFLRAGANRVVSPFAIGAGHIVQLLTQPAVVDFIDLVSRNDSLQLEVRRIEVASDSPFAGKTLAEGHIRQATGCMVLAIERKGGKPVFDPRPETRLEAGDVLIAVGSGAA